MAEKIDMIALSPTMESGTIITWQKKEGDTFASGDVLCEVETDKATMEYEAFNNGTILKIIVPEGGSVSIGETIAVSGERGEDISEILADIEKRGLSKGKGGSKDSGEDSAGDKNLQAKIADKSANKDNAGKAETKLKPVPDTAAGERIKASPVARVMAKREGIELPSITGSGPNGRIVKRDIEKAVKTGAALVGGASKAEGKFNGGTVKISSMRRAIAERLSASKYSAPHYYLKVTVNAERLVEARKRLNMRVQEKISINSFLIKLAAEALVKHPAVNSSWQGNAIVRFGSADIGLAVALDDGLITPVVRNCEQKGIASIDGELKALIQKAKEGKLQSSEYSDATFTISNLGSYGIEDFTAIINPPGSAILAVGEIKRKPAVLKEDGGSEAIHIISSMNLTLSCDHRVIDGAVGAAFLHDLQAFIEDPFNILF